jgi:hypothetical protein
MAYERDNRSGVYRLQEKKLHPDKEQKVKDQQA